MALNNSGKISLAGSTAGESIALELSKSATAMISMNDADVRALAGISTGMIQLDDFYGKSSGLGYFIAGITLPSGYSFTSLIYADNSFFLTTQTGSSTGGAYFGTVVTKINSNFTSHSTNQNQIQSTYARYNSSGLSKSYGLRNPIYDGNRLIYTAAIQKYSAGTAHSCGDVGLVEWDTATNTYVKSIQFGHYYASGTVSGPSPQFLYKSLDGNYYCLGIEGNTSLNPRGLHNLNKSDFTYNSAVISATDPIQATVSGQNKIFHPYKIGSSSGYWYGFDYYSSSSSTNNRFKLWHVDSSFNLIGTISEIGSTFLSSTVGINKEIFILSRINGSTRTTVYFQKFNSSGSLQWSKSFNVGVNLSTTGVSFIDSLDGYIYMYVTAGRTVPALFKLDYNGNIIYGIGLGFSSAASVNSGKFTVKFTTNDLLLNSTTDGITLYAVLASGSIIFMKLPSSLLSVGSYVVNGETITVTDQTSTLSFGSLSPAAGAALSLGITHITELQSNSHEYSTKSQTTSYGVINV